MTSLSTPGTTSEVSEHNELRPPQPPTGTRTIDAVIAGLVVLGIAIRAWAYLANTSLYLDEILVSRNILAFPLRDLLTKPLQLDQVAPRGFLLAEKLAVLAFGRNEYALRLFPFLCSIAGVFLFRRVAQRALTAWAVPFAMATFAIGVPLIRYGLDVKQYIVDATAALLLLDLALRLRDPNATRRFMLTGLVAWIVIWFSQASVVVMGGLGLALAIQWLMTRDRATTRALVITIPMWAAASIVAVVAGLRSMTPATREFMDDFWRGGFLPLPFGIVTAAQWLWGQSLSFFTDETLLRYPLPALFLAISVLGIVALWRMRRGVALLMLGPFAVAIIAAVAQQYPLRGRLMFYLVPSLLIALAAGIEWIRRGLARLSTALGAVIMGAMLTPPILAFAQDPPPYELEHTPSLLGYLQTRRQPGDIVHVFPLSRIAVMYYGPQYGLKPQDFNTSVCDRNETRPYVLDVDRYRGKPRVWLLTVGTRPYRPARAAVRGYLNTIGIKRDSLVLRSLTYGTVSLELFDLSDSTRLRAADARTYPVAPMPKNPRPGCRPWVRPSPLDSIR